MKWTMLLFLAAACAPTRFVDRPIAWTERDERPIPVPQTHPHSVHAASLHDVFFGPVDRVFGLDYGDEASNVNALDEVADSSWYHDRRRDRSTDHARPRALSEDAIRRGPTTPEDEPVPPFSITKTKAIGSTPGMVVRDSRGVRYLIKLDAPGPVGLATSTEIVASRLAWAAGWLVPSLWLVDIAPEELHWQAGLTYEDELGERHAYTEQMHARLLARTPLVGEGKIRVLASRWLEGRSLGPFAYEGRRGDDANDRVDHSDRRDLRGFGVFAAWINDVDTLQNNTLDMYEGAEGQGHVVHYQQDVGGAFGTWAAAVAPSWMGLEGYFDPDLIIASFLSIGLWPQPWEMPVFEREHALLVKRWPALGGFDAAHFAPRRWRAALTNPAFARQTARDRYWGAKRIVAFSPDELRAAISTGRYQADVATRLFEVLWERRRRIADAYLRELASLDYFRVEGQRLCFDDLFYVAGLSGESHYAARELDRAPLSIVWRGSTGCVAPPTGDGYHVLTFVVRRGRGSAKRLRVHLIESHGARHVVGVVH
jgi:hypothetical protein